MISVIIPVYNGEKYINRCLDSVLNNNFKDFEIIIINDGSKDNSETIIKEYCDKYNFIHYYYQENAGVSAARNKGIDLAKGEYVCFIDIDDAIDSNFLGNLYNLASENNLDWACCDSVLLSEKGTKIKNHSHFEFDFIIKKEKARKLTQKYIFCLSKAYDSINLSSAADSITRRDFLIENNIVFPTDIKYGEDLLFNYEKSQHLNNFGYIAEPLYYIYETSDSSSRGIEFNKKIEYTKALIERLIKKTRIYNDDNDINIQRFFCSQIQNIILQHFSFDYFKFRKCMLELEKLYSDEPIKSFWENINILEVVDKWSLPRILSVVKKKKYFLAYIMLTIHYFVNKVLNII